MRRTAALGTALGVVAVGVAATFVVRPQLLLTTLPGSVLDVVSRDVVLPALAFLLGTYAAWLAFTSGRITALAADAAAGADPEEAGAAEATGGDASTDGPPTISLFGVDVVRFGSAATDEDGARDSDVQPVEAGADAGSGVAVESAAGTDPDGDTRPEATRPGRHTSAPADAFDRLRAQPPEVATADGSAVAGERFDESLAAATASPTSASEVRETLRDVVVDVERSHLRVDGVDDEAVAAAVDAGEWTDDRIAAAFVADGDAVSYPLRQRLYAWMDPAGAFDGRVRRTVGAIEDRLDEREVGR
ncbi:MAG: hypothetical protein ABEJ78_01945 [Haloferacaceae archaeon]